MLFLLNITFGQDCVSFMPMEQGYKWEVTNYNKKGKETGSSTSEIISVTSEDESISAEVKVITSDGKDEFTNTYNIICEGSTVKMGLTVFLPEEQLAQMQNMESMEVELEMEDVEFPSNLDVGQELKDASMTMIAKMNGIQVMNNKTTIKDRKVVSKETITTSAGTYECFKIEQITVVKMGFVNREVKSVSFIAEGVGVVRSESYDKKGNLDSYSEITQVY